jgi:hypothetical protein
MEDSGALKLQEPLVDNAPHTLCDTKQRTPRPWKTLKHLLKARLKKIPLRSTISSQMASRGTVRE